MMLASARRRRRRLARPRTLLSVNVINEANGISENPKYICILFAKSKFSTIFAEYFESY